MGNISGSVYSGLNLIYAFRYLGMLMYSVYTVFISDTLQTSEEWDDCYSYVGFSLQLMKLETYSRTFFSAAL